MPMAGFLELVVSWEVASGLSLPAVARSLFRAPEGMPNSAIGGPFPIDTAREIPRPTREGALSPGRKA